jgi:hypothetical protein
MLLLSFFFLTSSILLGLYKTFLIYILNSSHCISFLQMVFLVSHLHIPVFFYFISVHYISLTFLPNSTPALFHLYAWHFSYISCYILLALFHFCILQFSVLFTSDSTSGLLNFCSCHLLCFSV